MTMLRTARTQKAQGIIRLSENPIEPFRTLRFLLVLDEADIPDDGYPFFARPCPVRPRHGFVESRICTSKEEVLALFQEVKEADPEGELVLMPPIYAGANWIVTPFAMTLGPGNDGATAGKGAIVFPFSLQGIPIWEDLLGEGEVPYIEAVQRATDKALFAVQYRSGPPTGASPDYIPREVRVERVFVIRDDNIALLDWENLVKTFPEGTVVYHPGGALSSHYGVHCVANGVPYLVSRKPQVGETLHPASEGWSKEDLLYLAEQIRKAELRPSPMNGVAQALAILHGVGFALSTKPQGAFLEVLAGAMVALARYTAGASVAELRYARSHREGGVPCNVWEALREALDLDIEEVNRDEVYEGALAWDLAAVHTALAHAAHTFALFGWERGYGGRKWASATKAARIYAERLLRFAKRPTRRGLASLVKAANHLLHANHNNGWYLNKWPWRGEGDLDTVAHNPAKLLLSGEAETLFEFAGRGLPRFQPLRLKEEEYLEEAIALFGKDLPQALRQEPPAFSQEVYAQASALWDERYLHVQVQLPISRGRDYGGVIDLYYESFDRPLALALAFEWGLAWQRGEATRQSLNKADNFPFYVPVRTLWNGDDLFAFETRWGWVVARMWHA